MKNPNKIAIFDLGPRFRGGQRQTLNLALGLKRAGQDVNVYCSPAGGLYELGIKTGLNMQLANYNFLTAPIVAFKIANELKQSNVAIFHASDSNSHMIGAFAKYFYPDLKLIVTSRTCFGKAGTLSKYFKYNSNLVNRFVAISQAVRDTLINRGVKKTDIEIINSSVDRNIFKSDGRLSHDGIVIGTASALEAGKGIQTIFKALAELPQEPIAFRFRIAGEGPDKSALEASAKKSGIYEKVKFEGFVENMADFYRGLDIYILASSSEGLGSSLLEAGACGCALVGSRVGGIVEIIENNESGLLFNPEKPSELAGLLRCLMQEKDLSERLIAGFQNQLQKFDIISIVAEYMDLYQRVLADE